ncbi:hypothetical protein SDC9_69900 [bioreactor metagenome]|uniref:Uncharacterized protein n=1 Tax=bioreactor metagenome TaxID=1076179 RepID=A0A644Y5F1_9ZZZZ
MQCSPDVAVPDRGVVLRPVINGNRWLYLPVMIEIPQTERQNGGVLQFAVNLLKYSMIGVTAVVEPFLWVTRFRIVPESVIIFGRCGEQTGTTLCAAVGIP